MPLHNDIFADAEDQIKQMVDPEQIINIDIDEIDGKSRDEALKLFEDISRFYYDEKFMKEHPAFRKKIDADLESLRINFKMRKADEQTHDILLKAIGQNSNNASLYKSLAEIQRTILGITSKIDETVARLENMMKGYQTELNFDASAETREQEGADPDHKTYRGTKAFIEAQDDEDVEIPEED